MAPGWSSQPQSSARECHEVPRWCSRAAALRGLQRHPRMPQALPGRWSSRGEEPSALRYAGLCERREAAWQRRMSLQGRRYVPCRERRRVLREQQAARPQDFGSEAADGNCTESLEAPDRRSAASAECDCEERPSTAGVRAELPAQRCCEEREAVPCVQGSRVAYAVPPSRSDRVSTQLHEAVQLYASRQLLERLLLVIHHMCGTRGQLLLHFPRLLDVKALTCHRFRWQVRHYRKKTTCLILFLVCACLLRHLRAHAGVNIDA